MIDPFKYYIDDLGIWLLGYRIEFSCLFILKFIIS